MKKSKKLLAFLLSTFMVCAVPAIVSGCDKDDKSDGQEQGETDPVKVKEGVNLSVKEGESTTITVADYITANGNTVTAESTNAQIATVKLENGVVTVTGVAEGSAQVKLKCGSVEVSFPVTVAAAAEQAEAPTFADLSESLDITKKQSVEITLAPKTGGDKFNIEYTIQNPSLVTGAEITEGKLKYTAEKVGSVEITVNAKCTDKNNSANVCNKTFKVTINVTDGSEVTEYTVTVEGLAQPVKIKEGEEYTLPEYSGTVAEGKEFKGWIINKTPYKVGDKIKVTEDITVMADFRNKQYTITFDGEEKKAEHGSTFKLPEYEKQVESGKQFSGWRVGEDTTLRSPGYEITITGNVTVTAVIDNVPETPPEEVKQGGDISMLLSDTAKAITISEYVTSNGHALGVSSTDETIATAVRSDDTLTITAVKAGKTQVKITCGEIVITFNLTVKNAAPTYENGTVTIDKYVSDTGTYEIRPEGADTYTYEYAVEGATVEDGVLTVTATEDKTLTVNVTATDTATGEVETGSFQITVTVIDTTANRIVNGGFDNWTEDGKPDGWTVTDGYGSEQTAPTYWAEERPFDNIGSYFGEPDENLTGTLTSSAFTVGGSGWLTFQLGGASHAAAIRLEVVNADNNTVLAKYQNEMWSDPENAQRLIPYKVDLSDYLGDSVFIRIVDEQAAGPMGFRTFYADSFQSYYTEEPQTFTVDGGEVRNFVTLGGAPKFADKTASVDLKEGNTATVELDILYGRIADCTYTTTTEGAQIEGSTLTYTATKSGTFDMAVTGTTAYGTSNFKVTITVTNSKQVPTPASENIGKINIDSETLTIEKTLDGGTADFTCVYALKTPVDGASVSGNTFTYTANSNQEKKTVEVTIVATYTDKVYPDDTYTREFTLSIGIVGNEPALIANEFTREIDLGGNAQKEVTLDLQENVTIPDGASVTYEVTDGTGTLNGSNYTVTLGAGTHTLAVKVKYGESSQLEYNYIVKVAQYSLINGDFETGNLDGWTVLTDGMNGDTSVISASTYWGENLPYNQSGSYHLDGWNTDIAEGDTWAVKSSTFTLGGSGYVSVKMGGNAAAVKVYKADGTLVGVYKANHFNDVNFPFEGDGDGKGSWGGMRTYFIDLHELIGEQLYIELHDVQIDGGWAHAFFDNVITYYETKPDIDNGYDTVTAPVSKVDDVLQYGEVNLKWRLATKSAE